MAMLTTQGRQVIQEISLIKYNKTFPKLNRKQQQTVTDTFLAKFMNKKENPEHTLLKMRMRK